MCMKYYDELKDKERTVLHAVYAIWTWMETEHDKCAITAHNFIHKQAKDSNSCQESSTAGEPGSTFNYNRNGLPVRTAPMYWAVQKVVPRSAQSRLLYYYHYPTLDGHSCKRHKDNSMQMEDYWHIWKMKFTRQWEIVSNKSKISDMRNDDAPYNCSRTVADWMFLGWTSWDHFQRR